MYIFLLEVEDDLIEMFMYLKIHIDKVYTGDVS